MYKNVLVGITFHNLPAVQAFINDTTVPVIIALNATPAMSDCLLGAIDPNAPITMPIELRFAKPHNAYVDITIDLA